MSEMTKFEKTIYLFQNNGNFLTVKPPPEISITEGDEELLQSINYNTAV